MYLFPLEVLRHITKHANANNNMGNILTCACSRKHKLIDSRLESCDFLQSKLFFIELVKQIFCALILNFYIYSCQILDLHTLSW